VTLQDVADTLPNGFHDAELRRLEIDYFRRTLCFDLDMWIGQMSDVRARELYRPSRLTLDKLAFIVLEPPTFSYQWNEAGSIRIDAGEGVPSKCSSKIPDAPEGTLTSWMFLVELNAFLLFACGQASLEWTGPEENRT
jgi:hypothetical protein